MTSLLKLFDESLLLCMAKELYTESDNCLKAPDFSILVECLLFINSSDYTFSRPLFLCLELYDEFNSFESTSEIMSVGLDLAPHYFLFLTDYR